MQTTEKSPSSSLEPVRREYLVFGSPLIGEEEILEVVDTMRSGWLGTGPKVARFQDDFAAYNGSPHAIAVSSATAALHLSFIAAGVGVGDEVITTAMTFCASVNAIIHAGATPVLADCEPGSLNISPEDIERRITAKTRAILPVHFAGRPCDMKQIMAIADKHGLKVVEDCAHAIETEYHGRKAGTFGDFGCFSFYVTKNVTTAEGGMITAKSTSDAARLRVLALHGMSKDAWKRFSDSGYRHYDVVECGFKYNMTDLQASIGIHQLRRVESSWNRRREIWRQYDSALQGLPLRLPPQPDPDTRHGLHLYCVQVNQEAAKLTRDQFIEGLHKLNIGVGVHYRAIPEHPYYEKAFGWSVEDYPNALRIGRETVSLPLSAKLTDEDVMDVVRAIRAVLAR
jgi:dTDP-4-amino-4,6-dideoxygalactose transaminase